mmetsp:Transcript_21763/g.39332  ORF Transcript_21763/g.39332 Transcript_21763/m.39332 type:complete len:177 (-) Transcript_21763:263-793(-)
MKLESILLSAVLLVSCAVTEVTADADVATMERTSNLRQQREENDLAVDEKERELQTFTDQDEMDFYNPIVDECLLGQDDDGNDMFGPCDESLFPKCASDERICFNRTNRRDKFWPDHQPYFYISYKRILCYPESWLTSGGCSSCSPGRWCNAEKRCILDNNYTPFSSNANYPCWNN